MYDRPANMFVAGFIGSPAMNLFTVPVDSNGVPQLGSHAMPVPRTSLETLSGGSVTLGVRPEDLQVVGNGQGIVATVELVEELGSDAFVHASVPHGTAANPSSEADVVLVARVNPKSPPMKGEQVTLAPSSPELMHVFDPTDGRRLSA
jgi:multiple sugar transport system ATP-binding protein